MPSTSAMNSVLRTPGARVHLVGVAGSGMSALASLLHDAGCHVTGCDLKAPPKAGGLVGRGIRVHRGHDAAHAGGQSAVIYSGAVGAEHEELAEASRLGIATLHRAEALAAIVADKNSIAVSGMHGKTSTTGMIARILIEAGMEPLVAAGGDYRFLDGNARWGRGEWGVFEADESDGTLLFYRPRLAVVCNLEPEHVNFFKDFDDILSVFYKFLGQVEGPVFLNGDDDGCRRLRAMCSGRPMVTFGFSRECDFRGDIVRMEARGFSFWVENGGRRYGEFDLGLAGFHQASNALAATSVAITLGIEASVIQRALCSFEGASRRFEAFETRCGVTFVDDYAHHPSEIRATCHAARLRFDGPVLAVFQPHRFSRVRYFAPEFAKALSGFDAAVVTDIYPGGEKDTREVSAGMILDEARRLNLSHLEYVRREDLKLHIAGIYRRYACVVFMGAGVPDGRDILREMDGVRREIPSIRGKHSRNEPMHRHTTFKLGGPADFWVELEDLQDLILVHRWSREEAIPLWVIGNGSNVIIKDGGLRGIAVRLTGPFFQTCRIEDTCITAGGGLSLARLIDSAAQAGLSGLENLKGIPGTVGGALHLNAGAYGAQIGDSILSVAALDASGSLETLSRGRLDFRYRNTPTLAGKIVLNATFQLERLDARRIRERVVRLKGERALRYPKLPNAGCIFRNPPGNMAGKIIDRLGLKDLSFGGARVSVQHGNFIVNTGSATASDVLSLMDEVRRRVYEGRNIMLENEVEVLGEDG